MAKLSFSQIKLLSASHLASSLGRPNALWLDSCTSAFQLPDHWPGYNTDHSTGAPVSASPALPTQSSLNSASGFHASPSGCMRV